jgi:hypothetical protein
MGRHQAHSCHNRWQPRWLAPVQRPVAAARLAPVQRASQRLRAHPALSEHVFA